MLYPETISSDARHSRNRRFTRFLVTAPPTRLLTASPNRVVSSSVGTTPNTIRPSLTRRPRLRTSWKSALFRSLDAARIWDFWDFWAHHRLNGEARPAACAPPAQHPAAADRSHAQSESVNTEAASLLRLVCTFWHRSEDSRNNVTIISARPSAQNRMLNLFS